MVAVHTMLLVYSACVHSPNANEPAHLAAGISHWQFGRFELYRVNPPLVRMVAAVPVLIDGCEVDWSGFNEGPGARPVFVIGPKFIDANGPHAFRLLTIARWSCIPFSWIGAWVCYRWANHLYGGWSGVIATALWCFSPNILAHAAFITPDAGATAIGIAAAFAFSRWLAVPGWWRAAASGGLMGLALLTKATWVILFGLWPLIWLVWILIHRAERVVSVRCQVLQLIVLMLLGLHVLNVGYGYDQSWTRLGDFSFISSVLTGDPADGSSPKPGNRFHDSAIAALPIPLPKQYVLGIDIQKHDFEREHHTWFRGEWHNHGFWLYYLYAMVIKMPIGMMLLAGIASVAFLRGLRCSGSWRAEVPLIAHFLAVLIVVSQETGFNSHLRYVLPCFPFAFVTISRIGSVLVSTGPFIRRVAAVSLMWSLSSSLFTFPHSLSYFNEFVVGPTNGHRHLLDSNTDWGQDLFFLGTWFEEHPDARPFFVAYYGQFDVRNAGLLADCPNAAESSDESKKPDSGRLTSGFYAISANLLMGMDRTMWSGHDDCHWGRDDMMRHFRRSPPVARAGYSILIFRVPPSNPRSHHNRSE